MRYSKLCLSVEINHNFRDRSNFYKHPRNCVYQVAMTAPTRQKMSQPGRPRVPQPKGTTQPLLSPPGMGNPFRFGSFDPTPGAEALARFPRPNTDVPPTREQVTPQRSQQERKIPYHRPASTTLSDTDSDREKELERTHAHLNAFSRK